MTLLKTISQTNVAEPIAGTGIPFNGAIFFGYSGFNGGVCGNNLSGIYIGPKSTELCIPLASGSSYSYSLSDKHHDNLTNWHVYGNAGDAVYVIIK